jgi:hypothetical protein
MVNLRQEIVNSQYLGRADVMPIDEGQCEGERRLHTYCLKVAKELGLEIDQAYWVIDLPLKKRILTVEARTAETEIPFSRKEIDDYERGIGISSTHNKVRTRLEDLVEESDPG